MRTLPTSNTIIDDRLLVALLVGEAVAVPDEGLWTTGCWYYRACRAAILGGAGALSGPFRGLPPDQQGAAIAALLGLPDDIALPDPRALVPTMVAVSGRHPRLNLMNVEAVAAAVLLEATVLLSEPAARGVLPEIFSAERVPWRAIRPRRRRGAR